MEVTEAVTVVRGDSGAGRIVFRADDERLAPFAGLVCVGELARRTGLVELIDAELAGERRAVPVKRRRRGSSGGELVDALAESQLVGGECFDDIEELRADAAGAVLRAVAQVPAAATALQLAKRFRRCLWAVSRTPMTLAPGSASSRFNTVVTRTPSLLESR